MPTIYTMTVYDDQVEWRNAAGQLHREGGLPAIEYARLFDKMFLYSF